MKILELTLGAASPEEQKKFYSDYLGFAPIEAPGGSDGFSFLAGHTRINFVPGDRDAKYHFAFNIFPDQLEDAVSWAQQQKLELLYSKEDSGVIVDFPDWWAKSIYFFDPMGNIVELIARGGIGRAGNVPRFSHSSVLGISEIGIVTEDVNAMREWITTAQGVPDFFRHKNNETFSALGDDQGLLLLVKKGRSWFMGDFEAFHYPLMVSGEHAERPFRLMLP